MGEGEGGKDDYADDSRAKNNFLESAASLIYSTSLTSAKKPAGFG